MGEMADKVREAIEASDLLADSRIAVQVEPQRLISPNPPSVDVYPADPFTFNDADGFGDSTVGLLFTVRARIDAADNDASQAFLLALLDEEDELSVAAAVESDQTLGGQATSVEVVATSGYRIYEDVPGAGAFLGCEWTVRVLRAFS